MGPFFICIRAVVVIEMNPMRGLALALMLSAIAFAQTDRGSIAGQITDSTGAVVPGVQLTITHIATNTTSNVTATNAGEFTIPNLPVGSYRIEVSQTGFKRFVQENVVVAAGLAVRVDIQLQLGQVSETIEVQSSQTQIQLENAKVQTGVATKMVDELPLVVGNAMRSPFNLTVVVPESKGDGQRLSLGGGQVAAWDATLDGLSITTNRSADANEIAYLTPSVDAITEFAVDTNGFKAEYGQAGGGVMSFVSRSGTNEYHGNVYDFFRNDALDAREFFAAKRSVYRQNDFGVTGGGPVWIPKIYNGKNRTFFFAAYEGFRNRVGQNDTILSVPTPEMYDGNFSNWVNNNNQLLQIYDPATTRQNASGAFIRDPFPGNQIPTNRFSATAQQMMALARPIAIPNRPGLVPGTSAYVRNNYLVSGGAILSPQDKGSIRVDHNLTSNQRVSVFYNRTEFNQDVSGSGAPGLPVPLWNGQVQIFPTRAFRATYDWTISPRLLNLLSVGVSSFDKTSASPNTGGNWRDKVCLKNVIDCNDNMMNVVFGDFTQWGSTSTNGTYQPSWQVKEDVSWIVGKHTLKFGYLHQNQSAEGFGQQDIAGRAEFSFLGTSVPGATNNTSGASFASFLLGDANLGRTETVRYVPQVYPYHGFYAQTDWRVLKNLTINLGLRYDLTLPPRSKNDQYSDFNPTRPNPAAGGIPGALWFAGFGEGRENTRSLVPGWYGGWGPRISMAYSPDGKTTIRAGYGRSFSKVTAVQGSGHFAGFIGQYVFNSLDQGVTPAFRLDQGLPAYPLPPSIDPSFSNGNTIDYWQGQEATRAPENNSWTFSVQRQVSRNMVLEATYNGVVGSHLQTALLNFNQVPTGIYNNLVNQYGAAQANTLLNSNITSSAAQAAGFQAPFPGFTQLWGSGATVRQALRPYPQYQQIVTGVQNGDKSGHSSYHSAVIKLERRMSAGLTFQWNYVFSKLITDSDTYFATSPNGAQDHYNRSLEKSIGQYDVTHNAKFATVYDLPFGKGRKWLQSGFASWIAGNWRIAGILTYSSGLPIGLTRNNPLALFNGTTRPTITSYDNWRAPLKGDSFDPAADRFFDSTAFPTQPVAMGNATRYNPNIRAFPNLNEDISLGKTIPIGEKRRVDFRAEAFNVFNRVVFNTTTANFTNLNSNVFGQVIGQLNSPRRMQLALKIYW